ncbi:hypothetical protein [Micromonospora peucetia]|uniref:DUF397 domain-containing protein n=1 Tax=Micromonospora peucetia TaxID=47871 RepID=A0ABZ1EJZ2_9ACTN|nr:hypothetical protein [Micromonospora peucetia]WSA34549.1 hypothetical protein OIE14_11145 [Micromonospora peucetia]
MSDPIATSDIPFGDPGRGVFAFRKGDRVPADLVESNNWQDFVSGAGSKSGQQAQAEAAGAQPATTTGKKG